MAMMALKSLLFFILAPGMVAGLIPLALLTTGPQIQTGLLSYLAFLLWPAGTAILIWCFRDFLIKGGGTPAPVEPPRELVIAGLYKYVRNPMYVGVLLVIIGHFLWYGYWNLLLYAAIVFTAFNTFVSLYEEPNLKTRFGATY